MKKLNFLCLLGLLVMGLCFVSCSDNDGDDEVGDVSLLIGLWEPVHVEGYEVVDGVKRPWSEPIAVNEYSRIEFLPDGTAKRYDYQDNDWKFSAWGNYQMKENVLILVDVNEGTREEATILSLTSTQLVMATTESDVDGEYYQEITYRKIDSGSDDGGGEITGGDDQVDASLLLGLWEPVYSEGYEVIDGEKKSWSKAVTDEDYVRVEFFADGTVKSYKYQGNNWVLGSLVNYQVKGNSMIFFDENGGRIDGEGIIHTLTSTQFVLSTKNVDGNWEYYEKVTYRKME